MSSGTMKFNGYLRVRIGEAVGLQPTRWSLRHSLFKKGYQLLDPYLTVSVDQVRVGQTSTKQKTNKPTYNEEFCANVTDGGHLELAVFHETPLGYDHFVANCTLQFQELLRTASASDTFEGWVSKRRPLPFDARPSRGIPWRSGPREFPADGGPRPGGHGPGDAGAGVSPGSLPGLGPPWGSRARGLGVGAARVRLSAQTWVWMGAPSSGQEGQARGGGDVKVTRLE